MRLDLFSISTGQGDISELLIRPQISEGRSHIFFEIIPLQTKLFSDIHIFNGSCWAIRRISKFQMLKSKKSNFVQFTSTGLDVEASILKEQLVPDLREGKLLLHTGQSKPPCNAEPQTSKQTKNNRSSSSHEQRHKRIVIVKSELNFEL